MADWSTCGGHGRIAEKRPQDQALLVDGEGFRVDRVGSQDGLVQLVWSPGNNPCRTCWEISNRFFGPTKG